MGTTTQEFKAAVEAFLAASGMSAMEFGMNAMRDPTYVYKLRKGSRSFPETIEKVRAYMSKNEFLTLI